MSTATQTPSEDSNFDLIVVGGASVDTFLNLIENDPKWRLNLKTKELCFNYGEKISVESSEILMGGNAQNVAVGISRLGYKAALMAEVGDDFYAEEVGRNLLKENIDTQLMIHSAGKDTSSSVIMNMKGDRTLFSQHAVHEHHFKFPPGVATRLIYLTSLGGTWDKAYQTVLDFAKTNNVPIAFNPGTRQLNEKGEAFWQAIKQSHMLFLNLEEAKTVLKSVHPKKDLDKLTIQKLMEEMAALGPKIVVITDGKNGSYARAEDGRCFQQGLVPATVVERTGAGDSFATGVIGAALAGKSLQKAMYWGSKNAASVVGRVGAQPGLLNRQQIESEGDPLMVNLGTDEPLVILPFDHRTSLAQYCFNTTLDKLTAEQIAHIQDDKMVIYEGVKEAIALGLPQTEVAIAVDEQFGQEIIDLANQENMAVILPVEKSGQDHLQFAYGEEFDTHIDKYKPNFTKAFIYYNPGDSLETRKDQQAKLKQLSDYSHQHGYKFLLEMVIKPTTKQLEAAKDSHETFNKSTKPDLRVKAIHELQLAGVEPDAWQLDYFDNVEEYQQVVRAIRRSGRDNVGVVISDYDANSQQIADVITAAANTPGVMGFAAGSAVFWEAIGDYHRRTATRLQARNRIAQEFMHLYQLYTQTKKDNPPPVQPETKPEDHPVEDTNNAEAPLSTIDPQINNDSQSHNWAEQADESNADQPDQSSEASEAIEPATSLPEPETGKLEADDDTNDNQDHLETEAKSQKGVFSRLFKR